MDKQENIFEEIAAKLDGVITEKLKKANEAKSYQDLINVTYPQFNHAAEIACKNTYVAFCINDVLDCVEKGPANIAEAAIRFNAFQLRNKGCIEQGGLIAEAQLEIATILEDIIATYFDK